MFFRTSGKRPLTSCGSLKGKRIPYQHKIIVRTLSDRHIRDDPFDSILPLVAILTVEVGPKLKVLAYLMVNSDNTDDAIQPNLSLGPLWKKRS